MTGVQIRYRYLISVPVRIYCINQTKKTDVDVHSTMYNEQPMQTEHATLVNV